MSVRRILTQLSVLMVLVGGTSFASPSKFRTVTTPVDGSSVLEVAVAPRHVTVSEALHAVEGPSRPPSVAKACRHPKPATLGSPHLPPTPLANPMLDFGLRPLAPNLRVEPLVLEPTLAGEILVRHHRAELLDLEQHDGVFGGERGLHRYARALEAHREHVEDRLLVVDQVRRVTHARRSLCRGDQGCNEREPDMNVSLISAGKLTGWQRARPER